MIKYVGICFVIFKKIHKSVLQNFLMVLYTYGCLLIKQICATWEAVTYRW